MFFVTRSLAERRGLELAAMARALRGESLVRLLDRTGRLTSHWINGESEFAPDAIDDAA